MFSWKWNLNLNTVAEGREEGQLREDIEMYTCEIDSQWKSKGDTGEHMGGALWHL